MDKTAQVRREMDSARAPPFHTHTHTHTHTEEKGRQRKFVGWLLNVPATCECISWTDLHRQFYVLPHWDRSCRSNFPSHPVTVYWHRADQSQYWPYNARRLAGVATGVPMFKSLDPEKSRRKRDSNPGPSALEAGASPLGQRGGAKGRGRERMKWRGGGGGGGELWQEKKFTHQGNLYKAEVTSSNKKTMLAMTVKKHVLALALVVMQALFLSVVTTSWRVRLESGRSRVRIPLAPGFFSGRVIPVT